MELVKTFKMFLPLTGPTNNQVINIPFIGGINSCCSRTYAPMYGASIDNEEKANNCIKYWKTKFLRMLVSAIKTTQHATRMVYILVPLQDFTANSDIDWSQSISDIDQQLYKKIWTYSRRNRLYRKNNKTHGIIKKIRIDYRVS